jgi:hypothetical protein
LADKETPVTDHDSAPGYDSAPDDSTPERDVPGEHGRVHPITLYGEPVLHRACAPVEAFDDELATLIQDMLATMYEIGRTHD